MTMQEVFNAIGFAGFGVMGWFAREMWAATWSEINASGVGLHATAIKADGTLWSWGYNSDYQLGLGAAGKSALVECV